MRLCVLQGRLLTLPRFFYSVKKPIEKCFTKPIYVKIGLHSLYLTKKAWKSYLLEIQHLKTNLQCKTISTAVMNKRTEKLVVVNFFDLHCVKYFCWLLLLAALLTSTAAGEASQPVIRVLLLISYSSY